MEARRSYRQFCGLARALDVLGERWTLLLVRELLFGAQRYTDLLERLPGLTTNLLAERLQRLEADGVVERDSTGRWQLSASGRSLEPAVMELARWGGRRLGTPRPGERTDLAWGLLSLKRRYVGGLQLVLGLEVEGRWYTVACHPKRLEVRRARPERAGAVVHGRLEAVQALLFGEAPLRPLLAAGSLEIDGGDRAALESFIAALLPPPFAHRATAWRANERLESEPGPAGGSPEAPGASPRQRGAGPSAGRRTRPSGAARRRPS